jgi:cell wall-associated NlpC family hydrolase
LIQTAYKTCGINMPRDSYMQRTIGTEIAILQDFSGLKRGDILCWDQHVALMVNATDIIHANAFHLKVAREKLVDAAPRVSAKYGPILSIRRVL